MNGRKPARMFCASLILGGVLSIPSLSDTLTETGSSLRSPEPIQDWRDWNVRVKTTIGAKTNPWIRALRNSNPEPFCYCSFRVTSEGLIEPQLEQKSSSPYLDKIVICAIRSLNNDPILRFPANTSKKQIETVVGICPRIPGNHRLSAIRDREYRLHEFSLAQIDELKMMSTEQIQQMLMLSPHQTDSLMRMSAEDLRSLAKLSGNDFAIALANKTHQ